MAKMKLNVIFKNNQTKAVNRMIRISKKLIPEEQKEKTYIGSNFFQCEATPSLIRVVLDNYKIINMLCSKNILTMFVVLLPKEK